MSAGQSQTDLNEIDLEALRWIARIERGPLGPHEQRSFTEWLAADVRHQGALIRVQAAELRIDRLAALAGGHSVVGCPPPLTKQTTRRRLIAAVVAAAAFTGVTALWEHQSVQKTGGTRYVNGVGELTKVALADGTIVTMNTQTELRVRYSSERRDIDLVRGEALFTVAHNPGRPFAVHVGQWSAVAVGTEFSVRQLSEPAADVTVTEGIIRLLPQDGNVTAAPQITANQKALIRAGGQVQIDSLSDSQISQQLAWRTHLVIFDGKPLREALTEMNRYTRRPIVVEDPALAERRIAGVFSTTDTKTFVSAMTATLGVEAVARENVVLLRSLN